RRPRVCPRRRARGAPLRPHDRRTPVPDAACPVACRDCAGCRGEGSGHDLMTLIGPDAVMGTFLLFCRIGATMMLMPGLSSTQIPAQIRLFMAVAASLDLAPLLLATVRRAAVGAEPLGMLWLIGGEL